MCASFAVERRSGPRPQRILVVDDSSDIRELWKMWLTFWGFEVEEARDGLEAVKRASARPPHLILMDLWMPVMDGWRATRELKASPKTRHVPVLALTAQGPERDGGRAEEAGCEVLLQKPCDPDDLLAHIRRALGRLRRA